MDQIILYTVISLSILGIILALILFVIARQFKVIEDPRIDEVEEVLPGANCGGCGYPGCRGFADVCVKADDLTGLFCPAGGNDCMSSVAEILGLEAVAKDPEVAVVRCSGSLQQRARANIYDSVTTCAGSALLYSGDTGCQYGCLGFGDCVQVCNFDAVYINKLTGLPVIEDDKCTSCGACVTACPKNIIELRKKNRKDRKIYVSCINRDKGGIAKKSCSVACTGCTLCEKECKFEAITIENFLSYIDGDKCKLCRKCAPVCPTGAILEINFPPKKEKKEEADSAKADK